MQKTSDLYNELLAESHWKEIRIAYGEKDSKTESLNNFIYGDKIQSLETSASLFSKNNPVVGSCVYGEIDIEIKSPEVQIPRQGKLVPQVRLTDGVRYSEWISKGVFFVDTRQLDAVTDQLSIHGFDSMLKAEKDYPQSILSWPAIDIDVVEEIAKNIGVDLDARTLEAIDKRYIIQYPSEYSCRETLGYIAAMYGGSFVMSDVGQLRLVQLGSIPKMIRVISNHSGVPVTFGGDMIRV